MITTGILTILYYAIYLIAAPLLLFPDAALPANMAASMGTASSSLHILDIVIPVGTLLAIILLFITIEGSIFTYKMVRWVYQKIPGVN